MAFSVAMCALWSVEKLGEVESHKNDQSVTDCALQWQYQSTLFILQKAWVTLSIVCNQLQKHRNLGVEVVAISDQNSETCLEMRCKYLIQWTGDIAQPAQFGSELQIMFLLEILE